MCGIAGILQPASSRKPVSRQVLAGMTGELVHRGPDEAGLYLDDSAGLGHVRLSIIDLAEGIQPIANEDESLWIIFNGEIFNYPELRETLLAKGHQFRTATDTEVILHLYEEMGAACVHELNGQFAFAIWNAREKRCFLARDRVGIRPLFYSQHDGRFLFASEIKAILAYPGVERSLDPVALDQTFTFWTTLPGRTPFKGVSELRPGHYMDVVDGVPEIRRYWSPDLHPREAQTDWRPDALAEAIQAELKEAARIRLRADVPVGSYLSGGLDSSGISALVARHFKPDLKTYGICFAEQAFDEGMHQREMVSFLKTDHTELLVENNAIGAALPEVIRYCERPLLRTGPVPLFLLSKVVRDSGLKVVLTGEGADEIFGGYNIFRETMARRAWARFPGSARREGLIAQLYPYIFNDPKMRRVMTPFFARGLSQVDDPLYSHLLRWGNTARCKLFFSDALQDEIGAYDPIEELRHSLPDSFMRLGPLERAQWLEIDIFMSNYLLSSQGDRMAMGHGVEIRMPYLDKNVMRLMGSVPAHWKLLGLKEKYMLKRSFRGLLPESICGREKHPYRAPIAGSLLQCASMELIDEEALRESGLFDPVKTGRLVQKLRRGGAASEVDLMALTGIMTTQLLQRDLVDGLGAKGPLLNPQLVVDRRRRR
jgi:asparagine synthase (glutamine-hydrolysing)